MKIKKLVLTNYKRLMLNNIKKLTYTPETAMQLILGTNGSGKSSVLYELGPLPAQSPDYLKGGFKEIELEHKGSLYKLSSVFKTGNKHSFNKDGEELNPGGTGAVQNELVWQEFGINKEIHELLIGGVNFTNLSPSKRREWITKLSDIDFTYALNVFKSLKSAARDVQGALKHVKNRLVGENNKLLSIDDLEALEERYESLTKDINIIFQQKKNNNLNLSQISKDIKDKLGHLEVISRLLVEQFPNKDGLLNFSRIEDLDEHITSLKNKLTLVENLKLSKARTLNDFQEMTKDFSTEGVENLDEIDFKIKSINTRINRLLEGCNVWKALLDNSNDAYLSAYNISDNLTEVLNSLPNNENNYYDKTKYSKYKESVLVLRDRIRKGQGKLANLESKLEHLLSLKKETCPKCSHSWVPGRSDKEKVFLKETIKDFNHKLNDLISQEKEQTSFISEYEEYSYKLRQIRELINQSTVLKPFWDFIIEKDYIHNSPKTILVEFEKLKIELKYLTKAKELIDHRSKLESLLGKNSLEQFTQIKQKINTLDQEIQECLKEIKILVKDIESYSKYRNTLNKYLEHSKELESTLDELKRLREECLEAIREDELDKVLNKSQTELAFIQTKRNEKTTLEGIIKDLEKDIDDLTKDFDALKTISDELSPVDGLIAEQLRGFINSYTSHVNQIIERIWNYELKVIPCGTSGGDLDYKFPLHVRHEGKENISPDISKGSEAQVEVVNFAFRLVTMIYLGLEEYPIYLDEFSKSFDEQHRHNAMNFIKQLIDTSNYTQLYMVSHYAAQFGAFSSAEVMVLDSTNISITKKHNQHVSFN